LRDASGVGVFAPRFGQRRGLFMELWPTIFKDFKLIMSQRVRKPSRLGQCCLAAAHRKSLRKKALESKIALDAVPHASHSIELVWRRRDPGCRGDFVNAGPVSRAEFTRTTSSYSSIAS
jgi:hypothetical protein